MHVVEKIQDFGGLPREETGHTAVILLGHGSKAAEANDAMYEVVRRLQERWPYYRFSAAFLEINAPSIPEGIDRCADPGRSGSSSSPTSCTWATTCRRICPASWKKEGNATPAWRYRSARTWAFMVSSSKSWKIV